MKGINKAILVGNLAAEPEFRILNSGANNVATVNLATNESFKDQQGNVQERTEWHRLVFWGRLAEIARDYLHKGSQVYVEGKIRTRSYEDQNGVTKYVTEIQVAELQMLGSKPQGQGQSSAPAPQQSQSWNGQQNQRQQWQPQQRQGNYQQPQQAQVQQSQPQQMPAPDAVPADDNEPLPF